MRDTGVGRAVNNHAPLFRARIIITLLSEIAGDRDQDLFGEV